VGNNRRFEGDDGLVLGKRKGNFRGNVQRGHPVTIPHALLSNCA
jgi:hypothetical protein